MAKMNEDTGIMTGLVGTIVLSSWRNVKYMKSKNRRSKKPRSEKQLQNQAKVTLLSKFIYSMKHLLDESFAGFAIRKTGANAAFSYNFKNGIEGEYPNYMINYSRVLVSRGDLPNVEHAAVAMNGDALLQFSWEDNSGVGQARAGDSCICVVYCPEYNITQWSKGPATRGAATASLDIAQFKGREVATWLAFISAAGKDVSDSVYTGQIEV